jgi:hypothetical protein
MKARTFKWTLTLAALAMLAMPMGDMSQRMDMQMAKMDMSKTMKMDMSKTMKMDMSKMKMDMSRMEKMEMQDMGSQMAEMDGAM